MRYSVILLCLLALSFSFVSCCTINSITSTVGFTDPSYVQTAKKVWKLSTSSGSGSAFPIFCAWDPVVKKYRTVFLTAAHCARASGLYTVENLNGTTYGRGFPVATHATVDLGLISFFTKEPIPVVTYTTSAPHLGETIYTAGWPLGHHLHMTKGLMSSIANSGSAPVIFGNSGGAVIDTRGRVVGVAVSISDGGYGGPVPHMMFFVPITQERIEWMERFRHPPTELPWWSPKRK
jgi:S1-C subfamily serine protease